MYLLSGECFFPVWEPKYNVNSIDCLTVLRCSSKCEIMRTLHFEEMEYLISHILLNKLLRKSGESFALAHIEK